MVNKAVELNSIEHMTSKGFIHALTNEKPIIIFCHYKAEASETKKIKQTLDTIKKELELLPLYEFIIDETDGNLQLAENLDILKTPVLLCYKDGCFSRYKDNNFTKKDILKFIGSSTIYKKKVEKAVADMEGLS